MWVIFRDPNTAFNHLDKYVHEIVEDKDILDYQTTLYKEEGGHKHEINPAVFFLQPFLSSSKDVEYFARRYTGRIKTDLCEAGKEASPHPPTQ
jgi:hypothetical protein